jgi:hypothetical protein
MPQALTLLFLKYEGRLSLKRSFSSIAKTRQVFRYKPLDLKTNEIRLLTVLPSQQNNPREIHCSLTHSSLSNPPQYHALSYAWQDDALFSPDSNPTSRSEIIINDDTFNVGQNLAAALKARQSHHFRSIPLWVDAICINQAENDERSGQILRMRDIYARASKVTVWLGPEGNDSEKAIQFIRLFFEKWREIERGVESLSSRRRFFSEWFKESLISRKYSLEWRAVHNLLRRAWWRRIWIVQEIVAARDVEFFCGSKVLYPEHLSRFLDLLVIHGVMYIPLLREYEGIVLEYDTFSLAHSYLRPKDWEDVSLLQALYRTGMARSSEPRDKIYAVLNLARDGQTIVPHPNYSLPIAVIYQELVMSLVTKTKRVDILSLAGMPVYPKALDIRLSTWVPDWTYRVTNTINSSIGYVTPVSADRESEAIVAFKGNTMHARGFILDAIDGLAHMVHDPERESSHCHLQQSASRSNPYKVWDAVDAIWRSLVADLVPLGKERHEAFSIFLRQCRNTHLEPDPPPYTFAHWYKHNANFIVAGRTVANWATDPIIPWTPFKSSNIKSRHIPRTDSNKQPGTANDLFHFRLPSHWRSRRFITTTKGFAGLAPVSCRSGDVICVILGCRTPIILRPVDEHFEIVGEAYVHGVMKGESMVDLEEGKYVLTDFEIW